MSLSGQSRYKDASEEDNRLDWWLREHGEPPTYEALRRIRAYRQAKAKGLAA